VAEIVVDDYGPVGIRISTEKNGLEIGKQAFQAFGIAFLLEKDTSGDVDGKDSNSSPERHERHDENHGERQNRGDRDGNNGGNGGGHPVAYDGSSSESDEEQEKRGGERKPSHKQKLQTLLAQNSAKGATSEAKAPLQTEGTNTATSSDFRGHLKDLFSEPSLFPSQTERSSPKHVEPLSREEKMAAFLKGFEGRNPSPPILLAEMRKQWADHPPTKHEGNGTREARKSVLDPTNSQFDPHPPAPEGYHWTLDKDHLRLDRNEVHDHLKQREYIYHKNHNNDEQLQIGIFVDKKDQIDILAKKEFIQEIPISDLPTDNANDLLDRFYAREEYKYNKDVLEALKRNETLNEAAEARLKKEWEGLTTQSRLLGEKAADYYASHEYTDAHGSRQTLEKVFPLDENHPSRSGEFDQIWKVEGEDKYVIIEAKGVGGDLETKEVYDEHGDKQRVQQGTSKYFDAIVDEMSKNPKTRELAIQLLAARVEDRVDYLLVHQGIDMKGDENTLSNIKVYRFEM
jgi:hypothetical protein